MTYGNALKVEKEDMKELTFKLKWHRKPIKGPNFRIFEQCVSNRHYGGIERLKVVFREASRIGFVVNSSNGLLKKWVEKLAAAQALRKVDIRWFDRRFDAALIDVRDEKLQQSTKMICLFQSTRNSFLRTLKFLDIKKITR